MNLFLSFAAFVARILPEPIKQWLYKIKPLAGFLRHSLNAAAPEGYTQVKIASGVLAGAKMELDLHSEKDYWLGTYEPELQQAAHDYLQPGMVVYDIGANIGYISLMFARLIDESGRLYAFEALPANIQRLNQNIALNGFEQRITIIHKAVVDVTKPVKFLIHSSGAMGKAEGSAGRNEHYNQNVLVKGISLDDFIFNKGNTKPDLIKMDIEGGEVLAMKGLSRTIKEIHPIFFIELHGEKAADAVWTALHSADYRLYHMVKGYPEICSLQELNWKAYIVAK
jgi:FkbM family methyltransferase